MLVIGHHILIGDPAQQDVLADLDAVLLKTYQTEDGRTLRLRATCIDTGGHHAAAVMAFCKRRLSRRVWPIKGAPGPRPIWPKRGSKTKTKETIFLVGVDTAKDALYGRLRIAKPGPGYIHFPVGGGFDSSPTNSHRTRGDAVSARKPYRVGNCRRQTQRAGHVRARWRRATPCRCG